MFKWIMNNEIRHRAKVHDAQLEHHNAQLEHKLLLELREREVKALEEIAVCTQLWAELNRRQR